MVSGLQGSDIQCLVCEFIAFIPLKHPIMVTRALSLSHPAAALVSPSHNVLLACQSNAAELRTYIWLCQESRVLFCFLALCY